MSDDYQFNIVHSSNSNIVLSEAEIRHYHNLVRSQLQSTIQAHQEAEKQKKLQKSKKESENKSEKESKN